MEQSRSWTLVLLAVLGAPEAHAQTQAQLQQDRRIEEEKRDELSPTITTSSAPVTPAPLTKPPVPAPLKELYFISLLPKRVTFRYDAAKAIVILMGVDEEYIDLSAQVSYLQSNQLLPRRFQRAFDPMEPLRKGVLAHALYRALQMRGGIALHLFGPTERHALKELIFRGVMSPGHTNDLVSGQELVQVMSQAADYKVRHSQGPVARTP